MTQNVAGFDPRKLSIFNEPVQSNSTGNSKIYKTQPKNSKSEDSVYRSQIRIIYNPYDYANSIVNKTTYALKDADGFFMVDSSLSIGDKNCPIFKAWKKLHYSDNPTLKALADDKDKNGARIFDKSESRWCLVQVVSDDNQPELVGHYLYYKLPKFLWDAMNAKMNPAAETKKYPVPVMDLLIGRLIYLEVSPGPKDPKQPWRETREISYNTSSIEDDVVPVTHVDGSSYLTADEQKILDSYTELYDKAVKNRDEKKREAAIAQIQSDPIFEKVNALYVKVTEAVKAEAPNIMEDIAYHPWSEDVSNRVAKWINIVLTGQDPRNMIVGVTCPTPTEGTVESQKAPSTPSVAENSGDANDLPF
jgi:hypothetical protein